MHFYLHSVNHCEILAAYINKLNTFQELCLNFATEAVFCNLFQGRLEIE